MSSAIPARPLSARELSPIVRRILATYRAADPDAYVTGAAWYRHAHELARELAELAPSSRPLSTSQAAGVIAALSPQNLWSKNLKDARRAILAGTAAGLHVGVQTRKADAILAGADPADVLNGPKETAFWRTIADPSCDAVVIDRHAHDIGIGRAFGEVDRGLSSVHRYANLARAYRRAAELLGELPSTVQAVTWQSWTGRTTLDVLPPADAVELADRDAGRPMSAPPTGSSPTARRTRALRGARSSRRARDPPTALHPDPPHRPTRHSERTDPMARTVHRRHVPPHELRRARAPRPTARRQATRRAAVLAELRREV